MGGDAEFIGVSVDSRKVKPGQLFVALKGERADGHDFVADAMAKGAVAALIERVVPGTTRGVVVESVEEALRKLTSHARDLFGGQVVAVLGAVGKTTTKEMLLQTLRGTFNVAGPIKSFNNLIGVALTVLNTTGEEDVWVLELGTNRKGEIDALASITRPDHLLYTRLGPEHLEGLGSTYGAVMEEYSAIPHARGFILIPDDAPHFPERFHYRYGFVEGPHFRGENLRLSPKGAEFIFKGNQVFVPYPHVGFAENALATLSLCDLLGVPLKDAVEALRRFKGQPMRMEIIRMHGYDLINDAYNSNPLSVQALLKSISLLYPDGKILFVFGDMLELGDEAEYWHRWAGGKMCEFGISYVVGYGDMAKFVVEEAKRCGVPGHVASSHEEIARFVSSSDYDVVVVKGSRGMRMEEVVNRLLGGA